MKTLFDTSVLVPALAKATPRHPRAQAWLRRALQGEFPWVVGAHTLAELYAVLSAIPLSPRIGPAEARRLIHENVERSATIVALNERDYQEVLSDLASRSLAGGIVYDALLCKAAKKAGVQRIVTFNLSHFHRVWPEGAALMQAP